MRQVVGNVDSGVSVYLNVKNTKSEIQERNHYLHANNRRIANGPETLKTDWRRNRPVIKK